MDLARLIHLTLPGDNGRPLEGMLTSCVTQPTFATPRHSWGPRATVDFAWDAPRSPARSIAIASSRGPVASRARTGRS